MLVIFENVRELSTIMSVTEDHSTVGPSETTSLNLLCTTLFWLVLGVCKQIALSEPELNVRKYPSDVDYIVS